MDLENIIIIGSGPAAHTAGIYAARAELKPLLFEGLNAGGIAAGGQLTTTTDVENYPGFPDGIAGPDLMKAMRDQSVKMGVNIKTATVDRIDFSVAPLRVYTGSEVYEGKTVIIATGATARRLNVSGEEQFWQKGVSACAVCDGPLPIFRDKTLYVVGGGDSACEEALFLTKYGSEVVLIHRRDKLRASAIMQRRVLAHPKIKILWNHTLNELRGEKLLERIVVKNTLTAALSEHEAGGLFYAVGHSPNTDFLAGALDLDEAGYIVIKNGVTGTSVPGVFAAGDVYDKKYRQAITAAGSGCMAYFEASDYLNEKG
ncbi:thioredoxin reductase [Spirochaetota bacterium]|nr:thioredoxin reductase [Spirochaetota bacterium]